MPRFCQYKDILGKPRTGLHALRIADVAIIDVLGTLGLAYLTYRLRKRRDAYTTHAVAWFMAGMGLHWLFCVDTSVNTKFGEIVRETYKMILD